MLIYPKKSILFGLAFLSLFFLFLNFSPARAESYGMDEVAGQTGGLLPTHEGASLEQKVGNIVSALLGFIGIIFFLLVLYGGFLWMTALGNKEGAEKAKTIIEAAAIGIIIVLAAYAITRFVFSDIMGTGGGSGTGAASTVNGCCKFKSGTIVTSCQSASSMGECRSMSGSEDSRSWVSQSCTLIDDCRPYITR